MEEKKKAEAKEEKNIKKDEKKQNESEEKEIKESKSTLKAEKAIDENASWLITYSNGAVTIKAQGNNTRNDLEYNSGSNIFSCYKSGQQAVAVYKKTSGSTTKASVSNAYLRFGGGMSLEHYSSLVAMGNTVTFGVALSKDGENYKHYACTPVRVNELGDKNPDPNGANLQYSVSFKVTEKDYDTLVYAKLYVDIDGVKYYAQEASYSMHTLAQYYLKYKEDFNLDDEIILALGEF